MTPRVSVVMAAKNYGRFLAEAVESVIAQTFTDWELLIIDDGSTDDTERVVRQFSHLPPRGGGRSLLANARKLRVGGLPESNGNLGFSNYPPPATGIAQRDAHGDLPHRGGGGGCGFVGDPRIRYVKSDRLGQSRAKNLGIDLARGEFIAFLDADDAWLPTKLEKQLKLFAAGVGVVFSRRSLMDESGRAIAMQQPAAVPRGCVLPQMFSQNFVCFSSAMVRKEVFARVGRFDPQWDLAIDYDLWLRVARHYTFEFVDEVLVKYRTGHGNLSKKLADRVDGVLAIMDRNASDVPEEVQAESYASTYRTIGHVMRSAEPAVSVKWYWKALRRPHQRLLSAKGLAASLLAWARRKRTHGAAENASVNR